MSARYTRKSVIQAQIESTYGTNPGSWTAAHALLLTELPQHEIVRDVIDRRLVRPYFGGSETLIGARIAKIRFSTEMAGSGTAGTAPPWGKLLRACGYAETVTASSRVEYTPVTDAIESLSLRYMIDGIVYTSRGARGTAKLKWNAYGVPMAEWEFTGFDTWASESAINGTFSDWKIPDVLTDANSADIKIGSSYSTGAVSGGTALVSQGMEIDLGNQVEHMKLLRDESVDIVGRSVTGKAIVGLSAADEVTWRSDLNSNTMTSFSWLLDKTPGYKIGMHADRVQRVEPKQYDYNGRHLVEFGLNMLPDSGNDELTLFLK